MTVGAREKGAGPAMQTDNDRERKNGWIAHPDDVIGLVASRRDVLESLRAAISTHPPRPVLYHR